MTSRPGPGSPLSNSRSEARGPVLFWNIIGPSPMANSPTFAQAYADASAAFPSSLQPRIPTPSGVGCERDEEIRFSKMADTCHAIEVVAGHVPRRPCERCRENAPPAVRDRAAGLPLLARSPANLPRETRERSEVLDETRKKLG